MDETQHNTDDIRIDEIRQLLPPSLLLSELPILESSAQLINSTRSDIDNVLNGLSDKLLVVVGPCSIHDQKAAIEYADHVRKWISKYSNDLLIVMRVYFEKPRTTVGWKGLINDPSLDNSFDINNGLKIARSLLSEINEMGVPAGTEFLDAISPQYYADLISWGAIGARTTESQIHRELASGLSMPIGFKNGTGGSIKIAVDGIKAASQPHHFLSVTKQGVSGIVKTRGNKSCHIILRGSSNGPNCDSDSINETSKLLKDNDLPGQLMVDCSHGNSLKDYKRQVSVAENLSEQISNGSKDNSCVGLEDTEKILSMFADAVQKRRQ